MRKFRNEKLWRDKLVDIVEKKGSRVHLKQLTDQGYDLQLRLKLLEEADEVRLALTKNDLMVEIADVYEVIYALSKLHHISLDEVKAIQEKKRNECGSFLERKYVTIVEYQPGSESEKRALAQPHKYPEIINGE